MRTLHRTVAFFIKAVATACAIGSGPSDARRKLRHHGPARYTKWSGFICHPRRGSIELASLMKKEEKEGRCLVQDVGVHL